MVASAAARATAVTGHGKYTTADQECTNQNNVTVEGNGDEIRNAVEHVGVEGRAGKIIKVVDQVSALERRCSSNAKQIETVGRGNR